MAGVVFRRLLLDRGPGVAHYDRGVVAAGGVRRGSVQTRREKLRERKETYSRCVYEAMVSIRVRHFLLDPGQDIPNDRVLVTKLLRYLFVSAE